MRALGDLLHDPALAGVWLAKYRMQSCHNRHVKVLKQLQDITASFASIDPILVLQANQIYIGAVKKARGCPIRPDIGFGYLESYPRRVNVRRLRIVHGYHEHSRGSELSRDCITQICREGRNSTLPRKVVADNRYPNWNRPAGYRLRGSCRLFSEYRRL
jgi:hypothetical protein